MAQTAAGFYLFINDRSDLAETVSYDPRTKTSKTRRESLLEANFFRCDVILMSCTRSSTQYALNVTARGYAGDEWLLDILTDEQFAQVEGIAQRMRLNALEFGPARKLLYPEGR